MESKQTDTKLTSSRLYTIFILEDLPSLNKGEMTIMGGILESIKNLGISKVYMLTDKPEINNIRYNKLIKSIDIKQILPSKRDINGLYRIFASIYAFILHIIFVVLYKLVGTKSLFMMKSEIWNKYIESDVFFVGHDGTFGPGGGEGVPFYLYPFYIPFFAKFLKKPVVMYGGGMPEFKDFKSTFETISKHVLDQFDLIILREEHSYNYLIDINVKNENMFLLPDPAFLLPEIDTHLAEDILIRENVDTKNHPLIGFTVTKRRAEMAFPNLKAEESYSKHNVIIANIIDRLIDEFSAQIIFVPHCIGLGNELDDRVVANDIQKIIRNKEKAKVIVNEYSPEELKGMIGQCDLFIGERLHSVVNAMSMRVPFISISNSTDQRLGIVKMVNQENAIYYIEKLNESLLFNKIKEIWLNKDTIKQDLEIQIRDIEKKAMTSGDLLQKLLSNFADFAEEK